MTTLETATNWGISTLNENEKVNVGSRIGKMLYQAILVRSLSILSEKEERELDSLFDNDNTTPEDVVIFLQSKILNFDELVKEERKKLKKILGL